MATPQASAQGKVTWVAKSRPTELPSGLRVRDPLALVTEHEEVGGAVAELRK